MSDSSRKNEEKKEIAMKFLTKIIKWFRKSEDVEAQKMAAELEDIREKWLSISEEVFDSLKTKQMKSMLEKMDDFEENGILERKMDEILHKLDQFSVNQPKASGISGVHNTAKMMNIEENVQAVQVNLDQLHGEQQRASNVVEEMTRTQQQILTNVQMTKETIDQVDKMAVASIRQSDAAIQTIQTSSNDLKALVQDSFQRFVHETENSANMLKQSIQEAQKQSENAEGTVNERFDDIEDAIDNIQKQVTPKLETLQGSFQTLKNDLNQIQTIATYLKEEAERSHELPVVEEDEDYVKEASSMITTLLEHLSIGAQLYAKHRETIEKIENNEKEKEEWELEKESYQKAAKDAPIIQQKLKEQETELVRLYHDKQEFEAEKKTIRENVKHLTRIQVYEELAKAAPIESWPEELQKELLNYGIYQADEYQKGTILNLSSMDNQKYEPYVDLATQVGSIKLVTSCYKIDRPYTKIIQKAKSERVVSSIR